MQVEETNKFTKIKNGHTFNLVSLPVHRPGEKPKKVLNAQVVSKVGHRMQDTTPSGAMKK